ncbi:hypothetical protein AGLY_016197 [Aphis glycines]|uniref:Uncharacterized protein n=1 Tax=Aphis glycines TaxID=307491 RepID=A0A6G0SZX0_APHGL|nr:hypothetical protein AGLY_016197 [Aphis glycines]
MDDKKKREHVVYEDYVYAYPFNINQLRLVSINQKSKPIICLWNENIRGRLPVACQKHCVVFPLNPLQEINLTMERGFRSKMERKSLVTACSRNSMDVVSRYKQYCNILTVIVSKKKKSRQVGTALLYIKGWGGPRTRIFEEKFMKNLVPNFQNLVIKEKNFMIFQLQNYLQIFAFSTDFSLTDISLGNRYIRLDTHQQLDYYRIF